eukprot:TRINITY_DN2511_c0_g1_i1.p1 TRINITY_DN2511_c0_g1~~TRINITY_DN2511_c0_g1_i1.p1  ORF type:complete len:551 (+),score=115.85 TRINITY_DN2511_c0_g1_i1:66-1655(+)
MNTIEKPSEKQTRYDRGVRLWGVEGQETLENGHVCLLGATASGCETLKNLVLPGVGRVTVVDGSVVTKKDLGRNFFVTKDKLGEGKAKTVTELLQEMNPVNVKAAAIEVDPEALLSERPNFFTDDAVSCVVAADLSPQLVEKVSEMCASQHVHLLTLSTNGMLGFIRLQAGNEHTIVEGFPDSEVQDLRTTTPFPSLLSFFRSFTLSEITDSHEHSHVPWPVIAYLATQSWREKNGLGDTALPQEYKQKKELKELIMKMRLPGEIEGSYREEENFCEAAENINKYLPPKVGDVEKLFSDQNCEEIPSGTNRVFWVLVKALSEFYKEFEVLPLTGSIPDMVSTTANYTKLRDIHREKALEDVNWIRKRAISLNGECEEGFEEDTVARFCKNARNLRVIRHSKIFEEGNRSLEGVVSSTPSDAWWFAVHLAGEDFYRTAGRYPGTSDIDDCAVLDKHLRAVLSRGKCAISIPPSYTREAVRSGHVEIHTIASVLGGIASQEIIKLLTKQRVPANNVIVYNGIVNNTTVLKV